MAHWHTRGDERDEKQLVKKQYLKCVPVLQVVPEEALGVVHRVLQDWRRCCELLLLSSVIYLCFLHHCGALSAQWGLNDVRWFILWSFFVISQLLIIIFCLFVMFLVLLCLCEIWLADAASVCFHFLPFWTIFYVFADILNHFVAILMLFLVVLCVCLCLWVFCVSLCTQKLTFWLCACFQPGRGWGETKTVVSQKEETL